MSAKWLGEQRADVWAFGCLLTSLAQHQKRAKELSSGRVACIINGVAPRWRLRGGIWKMTCTDGMSTRVCPRTGRGDAAL